MELVLLIIVRVVCSGALDPGAPGVGTRLSAGSREDIFCIVRQRCSVRFSWSFFFFFMESYCSRGESIFYMQVPLVTRVAGLHM